MNCSASWRFDTLHALGDLKPPIDVRRDVDRLHGLAGFRADALDRDFPSCDSYVALGDNAFISNGARILADNAQVHFELVLEFQRPVKLERRLDPWPADAGSIGDAQPGLAPHGVLRLFEIAEEPAEMDDARHVGFVELHTALQAKFRWHASSSWCAPRAYVYRRPACFA